MSHAAEAWFFDECEVRGNEGWVLVTLCNYADDDGLAALSKRSLVAKTRMSETSVHRAITALREAAVIEFVEGETGPAWWRAIPLNRRPRLVRLSRFLGSRFATPTEPGVPQGYQIEASGVPLGYHGTPVDQGVSRVTYDQEISLKQRAREADPNCVSCRGSGRFYNATAGADAPCRCTWEDDYQPTPARPSKPPADFGLPARKGA